MSTAEVEQPSSTTQSSPQHLSIDDVEFTGFRARSASRHLSRTPVIVVDDDTPETGRSLVSLLQRTASTSRRPSATEQGVDDDNTVVVIEDAGVRRTRGDRRTRNGAQTRPIVVLDSDDEQGQPLRSANSTHRSRRTRASSSFRIFSPSPPPAQHHPVPPVPPLPPIIAEPLPFSVLPPPQRQSQARPRLPFDEPPQPVNNHSHSNGSGIHLGGGLLSQGNSSGRRIGPRTQIRFQSPPNDMYTELIDTDAPAGRTSIFTSFFASYFGGPSFISQSGQTSSRGRSNVNPSGGRHLHGGLNFQPFGVSPGHPPSSGVFGLATFSGLGPWGRRDTTLGLGPDYDKTMTHPERAGPGWTFDFGTEKEESGSEVEGSEILVCAKCLDPLLANADGMVDVGEKEKKDRRVWGLRCGHILDGKCVDFLMMPERDKELAVEVDNVDIDPGSTSIRKRRRKGAEERVEPDSVSENEVKGLVATPDVKGKGKARASPANNPEPSPSDDKEKLPSSRSEHADNTSSPDTTSMRSRLRPRRNVVAPPSVTTRIQSSHRPPRPPRQPALVSSARGGSSSTRRRGAKRKRAASVTVEEIEERHEWTCPVSACGRVHVSIKMGGQWKMDPENGAVAIYV